LTKVKRTATLSIPFVTRRKTRLWFGNAADVRRNWLVAAGVRDVARGL
jgi:hypothetical protein